ncbi:MAG: hypothetical protein H8E66_29080 [Planctomycetes bacterium]|nr:hypothetical protein [Planctomycetota bacterium]
MNRWVEITFDCLPLRTISRLDIPLDASPKYRALCERIKLAIEKHGQHNAYFLYKAKCVYHLVNHDELGILEFEFEGVALTDSSDAATERCDLTVELASETCDWLTEPIVAWFAETVSHSVAVEFDRYIDAGDLAEAKKRIETIQATSDEAGGFVGMYL